MSEKSLRRLKELKNKLNADEGRALQWLVDCDDWHGPGGPKKHYNATLLNPPEGMRTLLEKLDKAKVIKSDLQDLPYMAKSDHEYIVLSEKNLERLGINPQNSEKNPGHERAAHRRKITASRTLPRTPPGQDGKGGNWKR